MAGFLDGVLSVPLSTGFQILASNRISEGLKTQIWGIHPRVSDSVGEADVQQTEFLTNVQELLTFLVLDPHFETQSYRRRHM